MLDDKGLDLIFREARTHRAWLDKPVSDDQLKQLHQLFIMAPTANNCLPARVLYVKSAEAKERLKPCLNEGNQPKMMTAPVCAIIGFDLTFYTRLEELSGRNPDRFSSNPELAYTTSFRNGSLQGGYFMLAARALGLDAGPLSGFKNAAVDAEFFAGTEIKSNFLCNLGYGDPDTLKPRGPRLGFDEVSEIL
jgi:3-hydroxypropanoate dehydrogenase